MDSLGTHLESHDQEPRFLADHLLRCLHRIEAENPYLGGNSHWENFKKAANGEYHNPADTSGTMLGLIYSAVIKFLAAEEEKRSTLGFINPADRSKILTAYLPAEFRQFRLDFASERLEVDYLRDAKDGTAETLIMGELKGGIESIIPEHRNEVRQKALELLIYTRIDSDTVLELFTGMDEDEVFETLEPLLAANDEDLDIFTENEMEIAALVLQCRDAIDARYGSDGRQKREVLARRISLTTRSKAFGILRIVK